MSKDYYAVLGVLPSAEDIVIKAAYRALAQRYHPDKWSGSPSEAQERMQAINGAYAVLSDNLKRSKYDKDREGQKSEYADSAEGVDEAFGEAEKSLVDAWEVACEYFPDLESIYLRLRKTSHSLAFSFKTTILATKNFGYSVSLAHALHMQFLETYFGTDPKIINFAMELIARGERTGARELNTAVSVLGSGIDADIIISKLNKKYKVKKSYKHKQGDISEATFDLARRFLGRQKDYSTAQLLIESLLGSIKSVYGTVHSAAIYLDYYEVELWGKDYRFASDADLFNWIASDVIPEIS